MNVRSLNQGKLEVVKQEMARVNVDILGISKLKWTGMSEFNWDDHHIYYCGQESFKRNGGAIRENKRVWNAVLGCNLKNDRMISVCFLGKPFSITIIQLYSPTNNAEVPESSSSSPGINLKGWAVSVDSDVASDSRCRDICLFQTSGFLLYFDKSIRSEVWLSFPHPDLLYLTCDYIVTHATFLSLFIFLNPVCP